MVFKVQDGIEFSTKAEWRNYMMLTYYSFHDVKDARKPLLKQPGSVNGQMFDIINCENSQLVVLDSCEQVQIDHVRNCRIFIGASSSTIYIRNCQNCTIYSCSKQLRLRECVNCVNYTYSAAEVHIEDCSSLSFACFSGGYPEHEAHLLQSNLFPVTKNLWHCIYDHTTRDDGQKNWRLLDEENYESWYPVGECASSVPLSTSELISSDLNVEQYQVGKSYGIEEMKAMKNKNGGNVSADSFKRRSADSLTKAPIGSSKQNGVSQIPGRIFSEEDEAKLDQLGIEISLLVASARAKGIDVAIWLSENFNNGIVPAKDFNSRFISLGLAVGFQEDFETKREIDMATDSASLTSIATICCSGYDDSGTPLIDVRYFLLLADTKVERFTAQGNKLPDLSENRMQSSKEVENANDELILDTLEETPKENITEESESEQEEDNAENSNDDDNSNGQAPPPTPSFSEPEPHFQRSSKKLEINNKSKARSKSAPPGQRSSSRGADHPIHLLSSSRLQETLTSLEELLTKTLKQPDMYHRIQVHLGFIEPYIMNLERSKVVVSTPRQWITPKELQDAFSAGRLNLNVHQVMLLIKKVESFATKSGVNEIRSYDNEKEIDALSLSLKTKSVILKDKVAAVWLKRYLVHLRVGKSACHWGTWLDMKLSNKEISTSSRRSSERSKEFRKALAGISHNLSNEAISELLQNFEILTPDILQQIVDLQLENWLLDTSGRRDFTHTLNLRFNKWHKENASNLIGKSKKAIQEIEINTKKDIKQKLLNEKRQELLLSERKGAKVTLEIFHKFDNENKKKNYSTNVKFGQWLQEYLKKETASLDKFRKDFQAKNKCFEARLAKESWMASLSFIESLSQKALSALKTPLQLEKRRAVIALRRHLTNNSCSSRESGHARTLVSWKDAQNFLGESFVRSLEKIAKNSGSTALFFKKKDDALKSADDYHQEASAEVSKKYQEWIDKKIELEKSEAEKRNKENIQKKNVDAKKSSQAKKAYRKWSRLHSNNKYFSQSERKAKMIPACSRANHCKPWRKELQDPLDIEILDN